MFEIFKKSLFAGLGLAVVTKTKLESVLEKLVEEGKMSRDEAEKMGQELLDSGEQTDLFVLELSSFQLETTDSLNATVSVILNISEDHMDRYSSLSDYLAAKVRICSGEGLIVINADDESINAALTAEKTARNILYFTLGKPHNENTFGLIDVDGEM